MIGREKYQREILFSRVGNVVVDQVSLRDTVPMCRRYLALETPGYCQLSLRDKCNHVPVRRLMLIDDRSAVFHFLSTDAGRKRTIFHNTPALTG